jgi:hypothetical protein
MIWKIVICIKANMNFWFVAMLQVRAFWTSSIVTYFYDILFDWFLLWFNWKSFILDSERNVYVERCLNC